MRKIRFYLLTLAGLLILFGSMLASSFTNSAQVRVSAQGDRTSDVRVVNTTAESVPVFTRGTTNVSGSVNITNTPTVNLAPGSSVGIDPLRNATQITNSETAAIPTRDVDFGRHPFSQSAEFSFPEGAITRSTSMTVPAGKRLVIEYVSGHFAVPTGQNITKIVLAVTLDQQFANHFVARVPLGDSGLGNEFFGASQQMRVYADGLFINVQRSSGTGVASATLTLSGYLIDQP